MADNANQQYDNPPFGTQPQSTGLNGTADSNHATNSQYAEGVPTLNIAPQHGSNAESLGTQSPGAHFNDQGSTDYTDPFAIQGVQGSTTPQDHGSTGTVLSSQPVYGEELTNSGLGEGSASVHSPNSGSASQASPWTKAGE
jgi:hypothetical protein